MAELHLSPIMDRSEQIQDTGSTILHLQARGYWNIQIEHLALFLVPCSPSVTKH